MIEYKDDEDRPKLDPVTEEIVEEMETAMHTLIDKSKEGPREMPDLQYLPTNERIKELEAENARLTTALERLATETEGFLDGRPMKKNPATVADYFYQERLARIEYARKQIEEQS